MNYYTELDMKRNLYNASHNKKANKVIIGWKVEEYLIKMASSCYSDIDIRLQWNKETEEYELSKFEGLYVEINRTIPYIIDVEYSEIYDKINNKNEIINELFFTDDEVRKIARKTDYKTKDYMDESLKDLKYWIEYDKYLKSIGEQEDNL